MFITLRIKSFPKINPELRISYNTVSPYFSFLEGSSGTRTRDIDLQTVEGLVLGSLLEKYNLTGVWTYERFIWGSRDQNGTFNGVIGRVNLVISGE